MKRWFMGLSVLLLLGLFFVNLGLAAETVTIAGCEWEPYNGEKLLNQGFFTEITVEALKTAGYDTKIMIMPWKRALEGTKNGMYHGLMGASYTVERTEFLNYPEYAWSSYMHFLSLKGKEITFPKSGELCNSHPQKLKVGVLRGSFVVQELASYPCVTIDEANTVEANLKKLLAGHLDLMLDFKDAVSYMLNKDFQSNKDNISILNPPYKEDKVYCVFSKKKNGYKKLTADFDQGIKTIKGNGIYQAILKKHGME